MRRLGYQNTCLSVIAVLLALGMLDRHAGSALEPSANAQPQAPAPDGGLANALEQRKVMIAELRAMNARLDRIESKLNGGMEVRVKDMPPMKLPPEVMKQLLASGGEGK
jgi:hypothetical protein